jgi:hypothetical protein
MEIDQIKSAVKEVVDPVAKQITDVETRLKAIEDSPVIKTPAIIISQPKELHGRKLSKQGLWLKGRIKDEQLAMEMTKIGRASCRERVYRGV